MMLEQPESGRSGSNGVAVTQRPGGELEASVQDLILSCNKDGMESLRKAQSCRHDPNLKAAFEQFKYAEAILLANQTENDNHALLSVTCNNLGCYYKKVGKYHGALSYLRRALKLEVELKCDEVTISSTHLNICAVLSKLEKHDKAVQHALAALELMSRQVTGTDPTLSMDTDSYCVLAVAYHSVGKEREFFEQWDQAALAYKTGYQVSVRLLGENHPLSLTLSRSCDAVLQKSHGDPKAGARASRLESQAASGMTGSPGQESGLKLPPVPGASPQQARGLQVEQTEDADWKGEEALWIAFAARALDNVQMGQPSGSASAVTAMARDLGTEDPEDLVPLPPPRVEAPKCTPLAARTLMDLQDAKHPMPKAHNMGSLRMLAASPPNLMKQTPFGQAMEQHPEALMDVMDAEVDGPSSKVQDYRPNRAMKRQTRTSRVVRRTGVFNSMEHRDRVTKEMMRRCMDGGVVVKSKETQRLAATRIQRVWREWYRYCQENSEWMTITWICATMIQSHWRSYHVRRMAADRHASNIQRHIRGFLVRRSLRRHGAAVAIQRRVIGMLTRNKLRHLHKSATQMQRLVRGGLARRHFAKFAQEKRRVVVTIQKFARQWQAKKRVAEQMEDHRQKHLKLKATIDLQRFFRGYKGRARAEAKREEYKRNRRQFMAATRIANMVRARQARARVNHLRALRMADMEKAATFLRKVWLGASTRRKYQQLRREFKAAEPQIIIIQRYMRGCMCRLRLWREAVETEEKLWATVEIQRCWRGYLGRVRWEDAYEVMWRREMAAAMMQRNLRGWLARVKFQRRVRRLAREEFERARARFKAAQRIQAVIRGVLNRKRTRLRLMRCTYAAMSIQRIVRGRAVRKMLWSQIMHQRATMMTALARGFLVRSRRRRLLAKVILIQRAYRRYREHAPERRQAAFQRMRERKHKAVIIQRYVRQCQEHKALQRICVAAR